MTQRRKLEALVAMALAGAMAWTAFGPFSTASGQEAPIVIDRAHKGAHRPSFTEPIFFLVLGGDARSGNPDRQGIDSIHIVGIDPVQNRAAILGIPRDSYVPSSQGYGNRKLTDLGRLEGVEGLIQSVEGFSQCTFDYYMVTAFDGFRGVVRYPGGQPDKLGPGLIDEIGGVTVNVTENLSEPNPVPVPRGRNVLNGGQALSFARNRHQRPGGDFDRSEAQGVLMIAILAEMRRDFARGRGHRAPEHRGDPAPRTAEHPARRVVGPRAHGACSSRPGGSRTGSSTARSARPGRRASSGSPPRGARSWPTSAPTGCWTRRTRSSSSPSRAC